MNLNQLIDALNRMKVETGSLVCLGCGHENSCGTRGCAILRNAAAQLELLNSVLDEMAVLHFAAQILGPTPERLQELAQAEKENRLFVTPVKVGDLLYPIWYDDVVEAWGIDDEPTPVVEVGSKGFFIAVCLDDPEAPDEFHPYDEIGKEFFLSYEDALAAIEKLGEVQGDG